MFKLFSKKEEVNPNDFTAVVSGEMADIESKNSRKLYSGRFLHGTVIFVDGLLPADMVI